jgi:RecB family exonuclease
VTEGQLVVSNSTIKKFKMCRRSWYLTYQQQWANDPSTSNPVGAAQLGTRIHCALEAYYGYGIDPLDALGFIYDMAVTKRPECGEILYKEAEWAVTMVSGYLDWAAENGIDADHDVVATEQMISVPLDTRDGHVVTVVGKLDQIVRRRSDGAIRARDWKTVGTLGKANGLPRDEQMRMYSLLMLMAMKDEPDVPRVDGVLYSMLLRSKRTARAQGPFYEQVEVSYNPTDHRSMHTRLLGTLRDMNRVIDALDQGVSHLEVAYPNPDMHCEWACPFKSICPLFDDGSRAEDAMHGNFVKADPMGYYGSEDIDRVKAHFLPNAEVSHGDGAPE